MDLSCKCSKNRTKEEETPNAQECEVEGDAQTVAQVHGISIVILTVHTSPPT